jgi:hypothetical protein
MFGFDGWATEYMGFGTAEFEDGKLENLEGKS